MLKVSTMKTINYLTVEHQMKRMRENKFLLLFD